MDSLILVVNPGSSSRKYALFDNGTLKINAHYEQAASGSHVTLVSGDSENKHSINEQVFANALEDFLRTCEQDHDIRRDTITAAGVRLVAPGRLFLEHKILDTNLHEHIKQIVDRAPLHIAVELDQISQIQDTLPDLPICLISDSAFHRTLSHEARNYAIPREDAEAHDIYRFGYHGISVKSVVHVLREELNLDYPRLIVCHLGSGASITAIRNWQSIDTTMGYSPLEGLIMATRSGTIDVEAALEIKKQLNFSDEQLKDYLNNQSGLLGLSGSSNDIRKLLELEERGDESAKFALDAMVYRVQSFIGAYYAVLGGLDGIVFTATVGERSAILRRRICESIAHLGLELDTFKNDGVDSTTATISRDSSKVAIHVIPSNEVAEIARQTVHTLANK